MRTTMLMLAAHEDGGHVLRSVYCAASSPDWLVASITTPSRSPLYRAN